MKISVLIEKPIKMQAEMGDCNIEVVCDVDSRKIEAALWEDETNEEGYIKAIGVNEAEFVDF